MPSRKPAVPKPDNEPVTDSPDPANESAADALVLAEEAEAEAAEAEAIAAAARARARAIRLRRQAQEAEAAKATPEVVDEPTDDTDATAETVEVPATVADNNATDEAEDIDVAEQDAAADAPGDAKPARARLHLGSVPLPSWRGVALTLALVCSLALLTVSVLMYLNHREVNRRAELNAEYSAAGRQAVVTLMSLDFNKAKEDVQRIIDNSTGKFKEDFQEQAENFAKVAQDSKVITEVTVNSTAVTSMTDTNANVLVSATSRITNAAGAKQDPRGWRLSVDLQRDGDQVKMSKVEFVP